MASQRTAKTSIPAVDRWIPDPDFAGRPVHLTEYDRPASGEDEALTQQTIRLMHRLANRDSHSPAVRAAALAVSSPGYSADGLSQAATTKEIADAIWQYAHRTVTYTHEGDMQTPFADARRYLYDQTLIAPAALLKMPRPSGDCVDFSMLVASLCRLYDIPAAYKTIAADSTSPAYSHVYVIAQLAPGQFYPLDASNGPTPGAEFDLPKGSKSKLWPNPADLKRPFMIRNRRSNSRLHARLGDDGLFYEDDPGSDSSISTSIPPSSSISFPVTPASSIMTGPNPTAAQMAPYSTASSPSSSSSSASTDWTKVLQTITNDATAISAPIIRANTAAAPYYITGANGAQILYNPNSGAMVNASAGINPAAAIAANPNLILWLGCGIAAVFALQSGHK